MSPRTIIFDHATMERKLRRIAQQLHEEHHQEKGLVLVGVAPRGTLLAKRLAVLLEAHSPLRIDRVDMELDKDAPQQAPVRLSMALTDLQDKAVVLVDDVLMSGRTLMHAAAFLVQVPLKRLTTVVLVDRRHRTFPIRADIVGLTLSTTVQDHITVELGEHDSVYLA